MSTAAKPSNAQAEPARSPEASGSDARSPGESLAAPPWKRALPRLLPALMVLLVAAHSICTFGTMESRASSEANWEALSSVFHRDFEEGDLVVVAPGWIDPLVRQYLGDRMSIEMVARMDAARYTTIWEVSRGGARAPETRGLSHDMSKGFGPLRLRRYRQTPAELVYDFGAQLVRARISGPMMGAPKLSLEEVGFEPHRCVKVVPKPNQTVSIRYSDVVLGSYIQGYVGLADVFTRRDVRAPGRLELFVNGHAVSETLVGVEDGWVGFRAETSPGTGAQVELKLSAVGPNSKDRRLCFAMEARR